MKHNFFFWFLFVWEESWKFVTYQAPHMILSVHKCLDELKQTAKQRVQWFLLSRRWSSSSLLSVGQRILMLHCLQVIVLQYTNLRHAPAHSVWGLHNYCQKHRDLGVRGRVNKMSLKLRAYGLFRKVLGIDFYKSGKKIAQQKKEITKFVPFPSLSKLRNKKNVTWIEDDHHYALIRPINYYNQLIRRTYFHILVERWIKLSSSFIVFKCSNFYLPNCNKNSYRVCASRS